MKTTKALLLLRKGLTYKRRDEYSLMGSIAGEELYV